MYRIPSSSGGAPFKEASQKVIRLIRQGCTNRPFFHISVMEIETVPEDPVIEQLGCYDPLPNTFNEKLVAINFDRVQYWIDKGALLSVSVKKLLGLAGYHPIHPKTYEEAWLRRKLIMKTLDDLRAESHNE